MTISNMKRALVVVPPVVKDAARAVSARAQATTSSSVDLQRRVADQQRSLALEAKAAATRAAGQALKHAPSSVRDVLDTKGHLESLAPGQTWTLSTDASVSVDGSSGKGANATSVTRASDGSFTVQASGSASYGSSAAGGAGLRSEYHFANAAEALRGANIIASFRGGVPTPADAQYLKDHLSAIEASGQAAAELSKKLDLGMGSLSATGAGKAELSVRVELSSPPKVITSETVTGTVKGGADVHDVAVDGSLTTDHSASLGASTSVRRERTFTLPSVDPAKLRAAPLTTLGTAGLHAQATATDRFTFKVGGEARGEATGRAVTTTLQFDQPAGAIDRAFVQDVLDHGFSHASAVVGATNVKASVETSAERRTTLSGTLGADFLGASAGVESATSQTSTVWRYPPAGTTATVADATRALAGIPPPVRLPMPPP